jgi:hypothetical protein
LPQTCPHLSQNDYGDQWSGEARVVTRAYGNRVFLMEQTNIQCFNFLVLFYI